MNRRTSARLQVYLSITLGLLLLSLGLTQQSVAQTSAATCVSGYALWADNGLRSDVLVVPGSNNIITGAIHSNADLRFSGSNNTFNGTLEYVSTFSDQGDANVYATPAKVAASDAPLSYTIADYRPGGLAAIAAQNEGRYYPINGDLDVSDQSMLNGLYYVTGNVTLAASQLRGTFTIVAEGAIDVSGSNDSVNPYADGLLLFSNKNKLDEAIIKIAGSNHTLRGVVYAPRGIVQLSGSSSSIVGAVLGNSITLNGSVLRISFDAAYCPISSTPVPTPPSDDDRRDYAADEIVIKLFNAADLAAVAQANGLNPQPLDQFGSRAIYLLRITDGTNPLLKADQLQPGGNIAGDARVEFAEPNHFTQTPEARRGRGSWVIGEDAGGFAEQWAAPTIRLAEAHQRSRGAGITVAVLDTGVDLDHPALAGKLVPGYDFVDLDADPREAGVYGTNPGFGHGTHVAGLVALAAPDAKIMPVRVLDPDGAGNIWVLTEGLLFAAETGPDGQFLSGDEARVINLSLGSERETQLLDRIVAELACTDDDDDDDCRVPGGVVVVVAAGNGGDTTPQYPAAEQVGELAIGASTPRDTRAAFSTYGPWVQLAAPGELIISIVPGGSYGTWSGTSMAAPLAAGAAALLRAAEPALPARDVNNRLITSGRAICGAIPARLDAAAALGAAPLPPVDCSKAHAVFLPMIVRF